MTRTPFLAANLKMFKTVHEAVAYAKEFRALVKNLDDVEIVVAPPFTALHAVAEASRNTHRRRRRPGRLLGEGRRLHRRGERGDAQGGRRRVRRSSATRSGGGCSATPTRSSTARRWRPSRAGSCPIVCVGETLEEREANRTLEVLDRQVKAGLDGLSAEQVADLVLAYEPVWAIGTGRNATPEQAGEAHAHIRERLKQWFGADAAEKCHILYGGSVKPDNVGGPGRAAATSTAPWSAAPAWTRTVSPRSSPTSRPPAKAPDVTSAASALPRAGGPRYTRPLCSTTSSPPSTSWSASCS